jgi:MFS family permease
METVAVGVLITELTGQAAWTGIISAAGFLPIAVLGPIGGVLSDKLDRRRYLQTTILLQAMLAGALTWLAATGNVSPIPVLAIVLLEGCVTALRLPAWQSILPDVVPEDDLPGAVSLSSAQFNMGRVIGPALAGLVIAVGGYAWAFAGNTLSFCATLLAVTLIHLPRREATRSTFLEHLFEGFRASLHDPGIAASIGLIAVSGILASPFIALVPAVAAFVFGGGTGETAMLVTAQGIGAVAAAVMTPLIDRFGRGAVLFGVLVALPVALVAYALAPAFYLGVAAIVLVGGAYLGVLSGLNTVVQLRAAPELRGRALSLFMLALGSSYPLGAVVQGALADRVGLRMVTAITAVALLGLVLALRWRRPRMFVALAEPRISDPQHAAPPSR